LIMRIDKFSVFGLKFKKLYNYVVYRILSSIDVVN
jgi:hypothetical protein